MPPAGSICSGFCWSAAHWPRMAGVMLLFWHFCIINNFTGKAVIPGNKTPTGLKKTRWVYPPHLACGKITRGPPTWELNPHGFSHDPLGLPSLRVDQSSALPINR